MSKLKDLRLHWSSTTSDHNWIAKYTNQDKICSIAYYVLEYINYNKKIDTLNRSRYNLGHLRLMFEGKTKTGIKGIKESNLDERSYFETKSPINKIKHTTYFIDCLNCDDNREYQRSHQFSSKRIRELIFSHKIDINKLEYFILLVYLMENSCAFASKKLKEDKTTINNDDLDLWSDALYNHKNNKNLNNHNVYRKVFNQSTQTTSAVKISWEEFFENRKNLIDIFCFLEAESFDLNNNCKGKYNSLQDLYQHHSQTISLIDSSTSLFMTNIQNIIDIKNICFELLF